MIAWRVYYGDGTTFDSKQGPPCDAPTLNCQCVVVGDSDGPTYRRVEEIGRILLHDFEYYLYLNGVGWIGVGSIIDLMDYVLHKAVSLQAVLKARSIPLEEFKKIYRLAWNDPDFPKKSATCKKEAINHFGSPD